MAWNTAETQRRLKEAAVAEFAAHGLDGTTVDAIAERAAVNKERLYHYFGNKERLFAIVLEDELDRIARAVPLTSFDEVDVGDFAGRVFDYHAAHPHLVRLLHWEGLSLNTDSVPNQEQREVHYQLKAAAFAAGQRDGLLAPEPDAAHLVFMVIAIAAWWFAVPQVVRMLTGSTGGSPDERAAQREAVVLAARRLAGPQHSD